MKPKLAWLAEVIAIVALGFTGSGVAQTTSTTEAKKFEVISVDGNHLVVRGEKGTSEIAVPEDFRLTVDGKPLPVSELKAGMKGTAIVTTKTTVTPVTITEVKEADVLRVTDMAVTIRGKDGVSRRFTRANLSARKIQLVKDGKTVDISDLRKGDKLTATVVTSGPPKVLTEKEVQVTLDEAKADPAPAAAPAPAPAAAAPAPAPAAAAPAPAAPAPAAAAPAPATAAPAAAPKPEEASGLGTVAWLLIAIVVAAVLFFVMRGKKPA